MIKYSFGDGKNVDWKRVPIDQLEIKIGDFGFSRFIGQAEFLQSLSQLGTRNYCAPEILNGDAYYGKGVDVYSVGVIACELDLGRKLNFDDLQEQGSTKHSRGQIRV